MGFSAEGFLQDFILPLVAGGELRVGQPLDADDLAALRAECATPGDLSVRIEVARADAAARCWLYPVQVALGKGSLRLAVGLNNALFLSHPASRRFTVRDRTIERMVRFTAECVGLGPPRDEQQLVARHSLLSSLDELVRTDVELRFWAGRRHYCGMQPPARMLAWPTVRRVEQRRERVSWLGGELSDPQRMLVDLLLWQSPLTALLTPLRSFPVFALGTLYPYLNHRGVCRVVCQRLLELGLERVGPSLARDFWQLASAPSAPYRALSSQQRRWLEAAEQRWCGRLEGGGVAGARLTLRLVTGLVQYLYATECLVGEPQLRAIEDPSTALCSVLVAAAECQVLVDATRMGPVAERMAALTERARALLGAEAVARQSAVLRAALHR